MAAPDRAVGVTAGLSRRYRAEPHALENRSDASGPPNRLVDWTRRSDGARIAPTSRRCTPRFL